MNHWPVLRVEEFYLQNVYFLYITGSLYKTDITKGNKAYVHTCEKIK